MDNKNHSAEVISQRLVDAILADNIFDKENLLKKIRSILKVWLQILGRPDNWDNAPKTDIGKLQMTIYKAELEKRFWVRKMQEVLGEEKMKPYYEEHRKLLSDAKL